MAVVVLQGGVHGIPQRLQGGEVAALQAAPRQFGEETLHSVHPGTGSGRTVKVPMGVSLQPGVYLRGLVGGVIVQNHGHRGGGRGLCSQGVQESPELLLAVFRMGLGLDLCGLYMQGGKEGGGAMPDIIMGLGGGRSRRAGAGWPGCAPEPGSASFHPRTTPGPAPADPDTGRSRPGPCARSWGPWKS